MAIRQLLRRFLSVRGRRTESDQMSAKPVTRVQPVPNVTLEDVENVIPREFPEERFVNVMAILNQYTAKEPRGTARVQLAAVKLANGSLERLRACIEAARRDYRNILAAAEYPEYGKKGLRVHKLPADERQRIIDRDWKQYQEWLRK